MLGLIEAIAGLLVRGQAVVLATVLASHASTPRKAGAAMIAWPATAARGSVGGGAVEAAVMDLAAAMPPGEPARLASFRLDGVAADSACGGDMDLLLERLEPTDDATLFAALAKAIDQRTPCCLLRRLTPGPGGLAVERWLALGGQIVAGANQPPVAWQELASLALRHGHGQERRQGQARLLAWPIPPRSELIIFGAGHIAQSLCPLAHGLGFAVRVRDDREQFATSRRFPQAVEAAVTPGFAQAMAGLTIDAATYLIIATSGHAHDQAVLAQALATPAGFIGMLGSQRKRQAVFQALLNQGFTPDDLARVHCPVGLAIGAQTPAEIAVSIAAQLVAQRAGLTP